MPRYVDIPPALIEPLDVPAVPRTADTTECYPALTRRAEEGATSTIRPRVDTVDAPCVAQVLAWVEDHILPALRIASCDRAVLRCIDGNREDADARMACAVRVVRGC